MKWSRFNIPFISKDKIYFLYNGRDNAFFKIDKALYDEIASVDSGEKGISDLPSELYELLKSNGMIVDDYDDENFTAQMQYLKRKRQFCNQALSLVIAPTLGCNFKCPYCYESNLPNNTMKEDIQDQLVDFINSHKIRTKDLSIYWHGGEPLLAFNTVKSLLNKINEKSELPLSGHKMVSNGYLFTSEICDFFNETKLDYVQITVDGTEATHNVNRIHKSGVPTYKRIIENIDMIVEKMPECQVGVRVNIHNDNKSDFPLIHSELSERWRGKNCMVYPAFVLPQGGCNTPCLSTTEKNDFCMDLYHKYNFKQMRFDPYLQLGTCSAIYENHYVIDPAGNLFKCWADFGFDDRKIGDLKSGISNWKFVSEYMVNSDKFVDEKCSACRLFTICDGGCNRFRIEKNYFGAPCNVCQIDEKGLAGYLEIIYEQRLNAK
jgi:uncharacterized protein